ncbi:alpha/beta fold hydrolase [Tunicatimonas pelagia]|uniref:alpha/beta fold hydrolase n=1 Tax=Tunicatimonas pelagia TaxID=931531 RepID=UPI002665B3A6|nr:alpha/beta hydrolase [Tunicatimonas pelagia]WKN43347.1 alpha/beta hydrolase [Tunicatimonas pelagia]
MKNLLLMLGMYLMSHFASAQDYSERLTTENKSFKSASGTVVNATVGSLKVPENRNNPDSEEISIHFVQLKSTNSEPDVPLIYLEGGPGLSCTWQADDSHYLEQWLPFLEVSDVILLDQRGTGAGTERVLYIHQEGIPTDILADEAARESYSEKMGQAALDDFKQRGVDLLGYTTLESAQDIDDLRQALSYDQFSLYGFSYGTHLGQAYIKYFGSHVKNAVLVGVEGLNHTFKLPSAMDTQFQKIALMAQADPKIRAVVPDLTDLYQRVVHSLDENPAEVEVSSPLTGESMKMKVGSFGLNMILRIDIGDASDILVFPRLLYSIDQGNYAMLQWFIQKRIEGFYVEHGMNATMDIASGGSPSRLARVEEELAVSPFRDILEASMSTDWPHPDLGEEFREPLVSNVRTLFMSGTLDFNTPPYQAEEVRWGFSNSSHIIVDNAGHEQILTHPEATPTVIRFLKGGNIDDVALFYPPIEFIPVKGKAGDVSHPSIQSSE